MADTDIYCRACGARQPIAPPPPSAAAPPRPHAKDPLANMSPRTAAILCYIPLIGWIAAIVVLAAHRFRNDRAVRFHAFQGLYLFVAWLVVDQVIAPLLYMIPHVHLGGLLRAGMVAVWVFMIVKASREEVYALPLVGELAERSLAER